MKKYLLLFTLLSAIIYSCKKNNTETFTVDAKIIDTGSPISDGCGYLIITDTTHTKPAALANNLDVSYMVNNLKVRITYHVVIANGLQCGLRPFVPNDPNNGDIIAIDAISKR